MRHFEYFQTMWNERFIKTRMATPLSKMPKMGIKASSITIFILPFSLVGEILFLRQKLYRHQEDNQASGCDGWLVEQQSQERHGSLILAKKEEDDFLAEDRFYSRSKIHVVSMHLLNQKVSMNNKYISSGHMLFKCYQEGFCKIEFWLTMYPKPNFSTLFEFYHVSHCLKITKNVSFSTNFCPLKM